MLHRQREHEIVHYACSKHSVLHIFSVLSKQNERKENTVHFNEFRLALSSLTRCTNWIHNSKGKSQTFYFFANKCLCSLLLFRSSCNAQERKKKALATEEIVTETKWVACQKDKLNKFGFAIINVIWVLNFNVIHLFHESNHFCFHFGCNR